MLGKGGISTSQKEILISKPDNEKTYLYSFIGAHCDLLQSLKNLLSWHYYCNACVRYKFPYPITHRTNISTPRQAILLPDFWFDQLIGNIWISGSHYIQESFEFLFKFHRI